MLTIDDLINLHEPIRHRITLGGDGQIETEVFNRLTDSAIHVKLVGNWKWDFVNPDAARKYLEEEGKG